MNKGPEVKETAFLYFHISLFACSHNMCSPASDENPLHSDTCDRETNNQICGKYRKVVSFTSYLNLFSQEHREVPRHQKFSLFSGDIHPAYGGVSSFVNDIGFYINGSAIYTAHEVDPGALGDVGDFISVGAHACCDITQRKEETSVGVTVQVQSFLRYFNRKTGMSRFNL